MGSGVELRHVRATYSGTLATSKPFGEDGPQFKAWPPRFPGLWRSSFISMKAVKANLPKGTQRKNLDFGFWILDFGSWILDFGFWIKLFLPILRLPREYMPHPSPRVLSVPFVSGDQMNVQVHDRLTGGLAVVDADIVAVR